MPTGVLSEQALVSRIAVAERKLRTAALNAVVAARNAPGTLKQLSTLIEAGRIEEAIQAAARAGAIEMSQASAAVYVQAGAATADKLSTILDITVEFDQVHDLAVQRMRLNRLSLVREWSTAQRGAVNRALTEGVRQGLNPIAQARAFRAATGLTQYQEQIVRNYRTALGNAHKNAADALGRKLRDARFDRTVLNAKQLQEPLTSTQVNRMVDRYRARMIKRRSETIARTEALRSVHAGNHNAFEQAVSDGVVAEADIERTWVAARDEQTRPDHAAASGQKVVGANTPFIVGGESMLYPGDMNASAEQTVNCRCAVTTRIREAATGDAAPKPKPKPKQRARKPAPAATPEARRVDKPGLADVQITDNEKYCGPAALSSLTGVKTGTLANEFRRIVQAHSGQIKGMSEQAVLVLLRRYKIKSRKTTLYQKPGFNDWAKNARTGKYMVHVSNKDGAIGASHHWIAMEKTTKGITVADNGYLFGKSPKPLSLYANKLTQQKIVGEEFLRVGTPSAPKLPAAVPVRPAVPARPVFTGGKGLGDTDKLTAVRAQKLSDSVTDHTSLPGFVDSRKRPGQSGFKLAREGTANYTQAGYRTLNKALRDKTPLTDRHKTILTDLAADSVQLQEDVVTYRGVPSYAGLKDLKVGSTYIDDGVLSTSRDWLISNNFFTGSIRRVAPKNRTMFQIRARKGARVVVTNLFEKEIIFMPGQRLRVAKIKENVKIGSDSDTSFGRLIILETE